MDNTVCSEKPTIRSLCLTILDKSKKLSYTSQAVVSKVFGPHPIPEEPKIDSADSSLEDLLRLIESTLTNAIDDNDRLLKELS